MSQPYENVETIIEFRTVAKWRHLWNECFERHKGTYLLYNEIRPKVTGEAVTLFAISLLQIQKRTERGIVFEIHNVDPLATPLLLSSLAYRRRRPVDWWPCASPLKALGSPPRTANFRSGTMTLSSVSLGWLPALRRYLAVMVIGNLAWEIAQLPLYTIWRTGSLSEKAFAVLHCTGGDLLIGLSALTIALVLTGQADWPEQGFRRTAGLTITLGVGYTIFSEWLNIVVRAAWQYSDLMPVVPVIATGLSPLLQWLVIPSASLYFARRASG